jgi:hypothetical protein
MPLFKGAVVFFGLAFRNVQRQGGTQHRRLMEYGDMAW